MLDILKTLITDFQEAPPDPGKPRSLKLQALQGKASVCIGVRRCGKSTLLFQTAADLLARGVSPQNLLYLNFFDDRLRGLASTGPGPVLEAYYSLFPDKKGTETVYCFFDEIQEIPGWEAFVSRLLRTERCEVFLTGSSAAMLSKEIATQMRGRALSWELFPLSFPEYLTWKGLDQQGHPSSRRRLQAAKAFDEYWQCGGFPEVIGQPANLRTRIHQEYFHTVLARDLVERHDLSHPRALTDLAVWLLNNAGSMYSLNRLSGYLKALGHKVPKASVAEYLDWLEDAFFLFPVKLFDASVTRANANPKKVYCVDHALVASVSSGLLVNSGHLLENLVFLAFRRRQLQPTYYKTRSGKEVDFVVTERGRKPRLVQVCQTLADPRTEKRELDALDEAMRELGLDNATLVTRQDDRTAEVSAGSVQIQSAARFLAET